MKCFLTYDQDSFREIQKEFSHAGIPGSLMTWTPSQEAFDQVGAAHRTPKEIWIPRAYSEQAIQIVKDQYEYHLTEFAVVIDRKKG